MHRYAEEIGQMDEQNEQDFIEWLRRGRKSFELELIDDDHPGECRLDQMK